jgi:hypothetical protein
MHFITFKTEDQVKRYVFVNQITQIYAAEKGTNIALSDGTILNTLHKVQEVLRQINPEDNSHV